MILSVFTELFNFNFFSISGWDIDLANCHVGFALETTKIFLSLLRLHGSTALDTLLRTMRASPIFQGILAHSCIYNCHLN